MLVGTNPRFEAPLVNTRIRKRWVFVNAVYRAGGMQSCVCVCFFPLVATSTMT